VSVAAFAQGPSNPHPRPGVHVPRPGGSRLVRLRGFLLAVSLLGGMALGACTEGPVAAGDGWTQGLAQDTARIGVGESIRLPATPIYGAALRDGGSGAQFRWTSSDPGVASVDASGLVVGSAEGTALITASSSGFGASRAKRTTLVTVHPSGKDREFKGNGPGEKDQDGTTSGGTTGGDGGDSGGGGTGGDTTGGDTTGDTGGDSGNDTSGGGTGGDTTGGDTGGTTGGDSGNDTSGGDTGGDTTGGDTGGTTGGDSGNDSSGGGTGGDTTGGDTGGTTGGDSGNDSSGGGTGGDTTGDTTGGDGTNDGPLPHSPGIWISASELAARPTSGAAWDALKRAADGDCGTPDLSNQEQNNNVCVMAKALVFARIGGNAYRSGVVSAIQSIVDSGTYQGRALALGRELGAYAIAADLIGLSIHSPALDTQFRAKLRELLTTPTTDGPRNLIDCHERRPNNWGTHCGGARAAVAAYLGDQAELDRVARVLRGWLGERSYYAGFSYGDLSWQCDESAPVGINPAHCIKSGVQIGGVLPDDQRRAGSLSSPPPKENYVWEGLQGAVLQAVILSRRGYDAWSWGDRALLRAVTWLHDVAAYPAEGDDTWIPHLINEHYGTSFPAPIPSRPGKNVGWTDWSR